MARVPPCATVNEPPLKSPPFQLITALEAIVNGTPIVPETVRFPCRIVGPFQFSVKEPLGVVNTPELLKFQLIVEVPVPPIFCNVPVLMKVLTPYAEESVPSVTDCHKPAL